MQTGIVWCVEILLWNDLRIFHKDLKERKIYAHCITSLFRTKFHGIVNLRENFEDQIWALWTRREKNSEHYKAWREQVRGKTWTWNLKLTWTFENALRLISAIVFNKCIEMEMCVLRTDHLPPILSSNICQIWRKNMLPPSPKWHEDVFKRFFQNHFLIFSLPQLSRHHRLFCKFGRLEVFVPEKRKK